MIWGDGSSPAKIHGKSPRKQIVSVTFGTETVVKAGAKPWDSTPYPRAVAIVILDGHGYERTVFQLSYRS